MKRLFIYLIVSLQIVCLLVLAGQYHLIDRFGKSVELAMDSSGLKQPLFDQQYIHVSLEIQNIPEEKWEINKSINGQEKVYVTLEKTDNHYYEVQKVTQSKPQTTSRQIVWKASYNWHDAHRKEYKVTYGFEKVHVNSFSYGQHHVPGTVTIKVSPWGQKKVSTVMP